LDSSPGANDDDVSNAEDVSFQLGIFDPRYWNSLDSKQVDILAHKGLKETYQFRKIIRIDFLEGSLHYFIQGFYQMERSVI
jgi:hypothetical protein